MRHADLKRRPPTLDGEITFSTPFGYMFPSLSRDPASKLPVGKETVAALKKLGNAMADPSAGNKPDSLDSSMPAIFTYFGQFIDHDITAQTDREIGDFTIGGESIEPIPPAKVVEGLRNGRRLQLDLDSVYGDGPGLIPGVTTTAGELYDSEQRMRLFEGKHHIDVPRLDGVARIADERNDENVVVSQFQAAMIKFHNVVANIAGQRFESDYAEGRQLVRWAYQYIVANEYLPTVCHPAIADDILRNGPRFFNPLFQSGNVFMPLEFSVAGFRFGHSMIRPRYRLNKDTTLSIFDLLMPAAERPATEGMPGREPLVDKQLKSEFAVRWENFVGEKAQKARRIDSKISQGLFTLGFDGNPASVLNHLAQRNLLRGYLLSLPTGQAVAKAMGIVALSEAELLADAPAEVAEAFALGGFGERTPLWYYVLREAEIQAGGNSLGAVGSGIVAETLIGLLKADPNSYLNGAPPGVVTDEGIRVGGSVGKVSSLADLLRGARLLSSGHPHRWRR